MGFIFTAAVKLAIELAAPLWRFFHGEKDEKLDAANKEIKDIISSDEFADRLRSDPALRLRESRDTER